MPISLDRSLSSEPCPSATPHRRFAVWILALWLAALASPSLLADPPQRADSTELMARLLAETAARTDPRSNPFLNTERLAFIKAVPAPEDQPDQLARYLFILGQESLLAGESAAAVDALERLNDLYREGKAKLSAESARTVAETTALAYLRLGEQENCITNHNIDRCLLPIRDSGVHTATRGSRGAITVYTELLSAYPDNLDYRWLLNLAYMTLGEHPEKVPPKLLIPAERFATELELPRFRDVAPGLGVDTFGLAGGAIMDDFDGDGYLDLVASAWGLTEQLRFYRNLGPSSEGHAKFDDATVAAHLQGIVGGLNISHADYNNDGRLDVLVLRGGWLGDAGQHPNSLLHNNGVDASGQVTFTEVAQESGLLSFHPTQVGVWADYDNDGWLDLFVGNETTGKSGRHAAELFRNNGPGKDGRVTFTEVATEVGIDVAVPIKGAAWGDIDNDGLMDLFISNNHGDNLLFHNRGSQAGGWSFVEIGGPAGVRAPKISFPCWFWDYDNDGFEDIFVSGYSGTLGQLASEYLGLDVDPETYPRLYRNLGDNTFEDVAPRIGLDRVLVTMGANFGDLENDGYLDFYAATGNTQMQTLMPNRMFRNAAGQRFQEVTSAGGFGHLQKGHGIAFGDLDHDGDQDIYAVMGGSHSGDGFHNALFENPGSDNRWISLELVGVRANRSAIGARIELLLETPKGTKTLRRTVSSGG
ncbi:MAG: VCBS repeat-containing protein, partial [Acidobacteriota bacterium]